MYFLIFFDSPTLTQKLHEDELYCLGTAQCDRGKHATDVEETMLTPTVQRRLKGSSSKNNINFPNATKLHNSEMGGVDLMDQFKSAYQLGQRSKLYQILSLSVFQSIQCYLNNFISGLQEAG